MTVSGSNLLGSEGDKAGDRCLSRVRVLEIGEFGLFHRGLPAQSESYYVGYRAYNGEGRPFFGLRALWRTFLRARNCNHYDLVVLHPPLLAWWRLRTIVYAFRFSVMEGRPQELYGALTSTFYFGLLRAMRFAMPLIAIDREDHFIIPIQHLRLIDKADAYYKRELPIDRWQALLEAAHGQLPGERMRKAQRWRERLAKLRPIALGLRSTHADQTNGLTGSPKQHDVFFAGMVEGSSFVRERLRELLDRLRQAGVNVDCAEERLPYGEFLQRCAGAWLTLSPEGFGWDCYRHVEAALVGSVPVINAPSIERYKPLRPGEHCFIYFPDDVDGAVEIVRSALAEKAKLKEMALKAHEHANQHLTEPAICRALIQEWIGQPGKT